MILVAAILMALDDVGFYLQPRARAAAFWAWIDGRTAPVPAEKPAQEQHDQ